MKWQYSIIKYMQYYLYHRPVYIYLHVIHPSMCLNIHVYSTLSSDWHVWFVGCGILIAANHSRVDWINGRSMVSQGWILLGVIDVHVIESLFNTAHTLSCSNSRTEIWYRLSFGAHFEVCINIRTLSPCLNFPKAFKKREMVITLLSLNWLWWLQNVRTGVSNTYKEATLVTLYAKSYYPVTHCHYSKHWSSSIICEWT